MNVASDMVESGLAGRYANALFELARDQGAVDGVSADLASLRRALETSPDLAHLVRSPSFGAHDQARVLKAILEKMDATALTTKFVMLLAQKRRLFAFAQIVASYEHLLAQSRGETEAEVTAARSLSDAEMTELKSMLKSRLGKEPRLLAKVDPSLLGGLVVKVGSRMIDSSLRTKLEGLRAAMKGN
jgi:F-type H+-transporting ATPase subunit delta